MTIFGKVFNGIDHVYAWFMTKVLPGAANDIEKAEKVVESPFVQFVASEFGKSGSTVARDAAAIVGSALAAVQKAEEAGLKFGGDIQADEAAVNAAIRLYETFKAVFTGKPLPAAQG